MTGTAILLGIFATFLMSAIWGNPDTAEVDEPIDQPDPDPDPEGPVIEIPGGEGPDAEGPDGEGPDGEGPDEGEPEDDFISLTQGGTITGSDGDDTFGDGSALGSDATVLGGDGDDTFDVALNLGRADDLGQRLVLDGGPGADTFDVTVDIGSGIEPTNLFRAIRFENFDPDEDTLNIDFNFEDDTTAFVAATLDGNSTYQGASLILSFTTPEPGVFQYATFVFENTAGLSLDNFDLPETQGYTPGATVAQGSYYSGAEDDDVTAGEFGYGQTIDTGAGDDTVSSGGAGRATISMGDGDDLYRSGNLSFSQEPDYIYGGQGNDTFDVGVQTSRDAASENYTRLFGGAGQDIFDVEISQDAIFYDPDRLDDLPTVALLEIRDFEPGEDVLTIDLTRGFPEGQTFVGVELVELGGETQVVLRMNGILATSGFTNFDPDVVVIAPGGIETTDGPVDYSYSIRVGATGLTLDDLTVLLPDEAAAA